MPDFNHRPKSHEQVTALMDEPLALERGGHTPREYLGGSRLGVECERALQFEYRHIPADPGREFSGRLLRVFEVGHVLEDLAVRWLRLIGFDLYTRQAQGGQLGLSVAGGRIRRHVDGHLLGRPASVGIGSPASRVCKPRKDKSRLAPSQHPL